MTVSDTMGSVMYVHVYAVQPIMVTLNIELRRLTLFNPFEGPDRLATFRPQYHYASFTSRSDTTLLAKVSLCLIPVGAKMAERVARSTFAG